MNSTVNLIALEMQVGEGEKPLSLIIDMCKRELEGLPVSAPGYNKSSGQGGIYVSIIKEEQPLLHVMDRNSRNASAE